MSMDDDIHKAFADVMAAALSLLAGQSMGADFTTDHDREIVLDGVYTKGVWPKGVRVVPTYRLPVAAPVTVAATLGDQPPEHMQVREYTLTDASKTAVFYRSKTT